jgi:pimeloyl-ACP methyl ester carboxylesterase
MVPYDEMSFFAENAAEFGLPFAAPVVERIRVPIGDDRSLSGLRWGTAEPEFIFLHGGGQNAHTWDTVAMALARPMVALDLPGHGHSDDAGPAGPADPWNNATDVAAAMRVLTPSGAVVVGMSLGGLTTIALSDLVPELTRSLVVVDVTPGVTAAKAAAIASFVNGPETFADFDAILARTVEHNPTRTVASLRRGILHNARQLDDGSWVWRYRRPNGAAFGGDIVRRDLSTLWDAIENDRAPMLFVRGMRSGSVVDDNDEAELRRRRPSVSVLRLDAGHSVQGDAPVELAAMIDEFARPREL